ncbi:hypothetical protein B0H14DRAFT_2773554, partial [Mycena olivaceomarginata]
VRIPVAWFLSPIILHHPAAFEFCPLHNLLTRSSLHAMPPMRLCQDPLKTEVQALTQVCVTRPKPRQFPQLSSILQHQTSSCMVLKVVRSHACFKTASIGHSLIFKLHNPESTYS